MCSLQHGYEAFILPRHVEDCVVQLQETDENVEGLEEEAFCFTDVLILSPSLEPVPSTQSKSILLMISWQAMARTMWLTPSHECFLWMGLSGIRMFEYFGTPALYHTIQRTCKKVWHVMNSDWTLWLMCGAQNGFIQRLGSQICSKSECVMKDWLLCDASEFFWVSHALTSVHLLCEWCYI